MKKLALVLGLFGASEAWAADPTLKLPSGKTITCAEAWKFADGQFKMGASILLAKDDADRQDRRKKILDETRAHITRLKADWDKKSKEQKKALWSEVVWTAAFKAVSVGASKSAAAATEPELKKYAEVAAERSVANLDLLRKGAFGSVSASDVVVMPFGTLISIAEKGTLYGWILDGGMFAISVAALAGDMSLTNDQFSGEISQLEDLADKLSTRMATTDKSAIDNFRAELAKKCPR